MEERLMDRPVRYWDQVESVPIGMTVSRRPGRTLLGVRRRVSGVEGRFTSFAKFGGRFRNWYRTLHPPRFQSHIPDT